MATILTEGKSITRELLVKVNDVGPRELLVTIRSDGFIALRAKGRDTSVLWSAAALYDKGVKEGRVMKKHKRTVIKEKTE